MTNRTIYAILATLTLWLAVALRTLAGGGWELAGLVVAAIGLYCACAEQQGRRE